MEYAELEQSLHDRIDQTLPRVTGEVKALIRSSIRIISQPPSEDELPIGTSHFGGTPDLPENFAWPIWNDKPLAFIAQINLQDVTPLDTDQLLPSSGILYFFYDADQSTWGFDPQDRGSARVLYFNGDFDLLRQTTFPAELEQENEHGERALYEPCSLEFSREVSMPSDDTIYIGKLNLIDAREQELISRKQGNNHPALLPDANQEGPLDDERDKYYGVREALLEMQGDTVHQMLGYAVEIQGDMESECQLASNGVNVGSPRGYRDPRVQALEAGTADWQLLLQVDSDNSPGWMWGDVGRIYYWIRRQDLAERNFDSVWLVLQCG